MKALFLKYILYIALLAFQFVLVIAQFSNGYRNGRYIEHGFVSASTGHNPGRINYEVSTVYPSEDEIEFGLGYSGFPSTVFVSDSRDTGRYDNGSNHFYGSWGRTRRGNFWRGPPDYGGMAIRRYGF